MSRGGRDDFFKNSYLVERIDYFFCRGKNWGAPGEFVPIYIVEGRGVSFSGKAFRNSKNSRTR